MSVHRVIEGIYTVLIPSLLRKYMTYSLHNPHMNGRTFAFTIHSKPPNNRTCQVIDTELYHRIKRISIYLSTGPVLGTRWIMVGLLKLGTTRDRQHSIPQVTSFRNVRSRKKKNCNRASSSVSSGLNPNNRCILLWSPENGSYQDKNSCRKYFVHPSDRC